MGDPNLPSFIWSVADLLRGNYKQSEYGKVLLPFTVLRRLDCVAHTDFFGAAARRPSVFGLAANADFSALRAAGV